MCAAIRKKCCESKINVMVQPVNALQTRLKRRIVTANSLYRLQARTWHNITMNLGEKRNRKGKFLPYSIELRVMPQQAKIYLIAFSTCLPALIKHILGAQSCPALCNPTDWSLPGSSGVCCCALLQGIFWTPGIEAVSPTSPTLACGFLTVESSGKPLECYTGQ